MDVYLVLHVGVITRARCSHLSVITVEFMHRAAKTEKTGYGERNIIELLSF